MAPVTNNGKLRVDDENVSSAKEEGIRDFTVEEESLFLRRFENGYNLHDPKYISWLKINHAEATVQPNFSFCRSYLKTSIPRRLLHWQCTFIRLIIYQMQVSHHK